MCQPCPLLQVSWTLGYLMKQLTQLLRNTIITGKETSSLKSSEAKYQREEGVPITSSFWQGLGE